MVITARIDHETLRIVDEVAKAQGRSRAGFVARAVRRAAENESEFLAFVKEGEDAITRGEVVPHGDVMAMLDEMIEKHRSRCAQ